MPPSKPPASTALAVSLRTTDGREQVIEESFGPAMVSLTERQRAYVLALTMGAGNNATSAALAAGYTGDRDTLGVTASRLNNHPKVQAAIHEEAERRLFGAKLLATSVLIEIAQDTAAKGSDRLKAAGMILNRVGLSEKTEHHVVVQHTRTENEMIAEVAEMAKRLGMDPKRVLGSVGVMIEVEATEILTGLEDVF